MSKSSLFILFLFSSQLIFAWGRAGHQIVGHVADNYTSEKTKAAIHKILGDESLSEAAIWMDDMMSDDRYKYMDHWHYVKKDEHLENNGLIMVEKFAKMLKDENTSDKDRVLALRAITHIVGDLHTPLHCGYIKDAGGNTVKLKWVHPSSKTNLHKVWDTDMIKMKMKTEADYSNDLVSEIKDHDVSEWSAVTDPKIWVDESQSYLDEVYKFEGKHIDKEYYNAHIATVDLRLSQSGVRLANLLNSIFE